MSGVSVSRQLRNLLGVLAFDAPRMLPQLLSRAGWVNVRNRDDALERAPASRAVASANPWSTDLHAARVLPRLGRWVMRRALTQWPIKFADRSSSAARPDISFVLPHRGLDRLPQLRRVIRSILAQEKVAVECIVVEQAATSELSGLPEGVRHIHLPHADDPGPWRKSWALNVGVESARADIVVCHDGDILAPAGYAAEVLRHLRDGEFDAAFLQRFLFYLGPDASSERQLDAALAIGECERINQNWVGGTFAIRKQAYRDIGGCDENFVDWGGEDDEFFDRCALLRRYACGYLPFVHLWHAPQVGKFDAARDDAHAVLMQALRVPAADRVRTLRRRAASGDVERSD